MCALGTKILGASWVPPGTFNEGHQQWLAKVTTYVRDALVAHGTAGLEERAARVIRNAEAVGQVCVLSTESLNFSNIDIAPISSVQPRISTALTASSASMEPVAAETKSAYYILGNDVIKRTAIQGVGKKELRTLENCLSLLNIMHHLSSPSAYSAPPFVSSLYQANMTKGRDDCRLAAAARAVFAPIEAFADSGHIQCHPTFPRTAPTRPIQIHQQDTYYCQPNEHQQKRN